MRCTSVFVLVVLLSSSGCQLSDYPFLSGFGAVRGVVEVNGNPVEGALVTCSGASRYTPPATTDLDGSFTLHDVPAGEHNLVVRAVSEEKALRTEVIVVSDRTSDLGVLSLQDAVDVPVTLMDPDLGIENAQITIEEIPGFESLTDWDGEAVLRCIPPTGTYSIVITRPPFFFAPIVLPRQSHWDAYLLVEPERSTNAQRAQSHNLYDRLQRLQDELAACSADCRLPDRWNWEDPPCARPVSQDIDPDNPVEAELRKLIETGTRAYRFEDRTSCPAPGALNTRCESGECALASSDTLLGVSRIASGMDWACVAEWIDNNCILATNDANNFEEITFCLGMGMLEELDPDELYLFVMDSSDEPPELVLTLMEGEICHLYFETFIYPIRPEVEYSPSDVPALPWSLLKLRFSPGTAPASDNLTYHRSWISPLN